MHAWREILKLANLGEIEKRSFPGVRCAAWCAVFACTLYRQSENRISISVSSRINNNILVRTT
eukprot:COSAG01_NODE_29092_length_645_cov_1.624542_1_plen_62_part_10